MVQHYNIVPKEGYLYKYTVYAMEFGTAIYGPLWINHNYFGISIRPAEGYSVVTFL